MSRSAAARTPQHEQHEHERRALRRPPAPTQPRRVSGPAYPASAAHPASRPATAAARAQSAYAPAPGYGPPRRRASARPPLRLAAGGAAIALRVADSAVHVSHSRAMDRVVRSRAWVVIIGLGLIGIVAMQVSMLKLNSGIGRAVDTIATLERSNASLKADVSQLSSGDRIQSLAGARGFVMPEPADVTYLTAGDKRAASLRAARRMRAPDAAIAGPAGAAIAAAPDSLTGTTAPVPTTGIAVAQTPANTAAATATTTAAPAATANPAATAQQPATQQPVAQPTPATATATATATGTGASGAGAAPAASQTTAAGGVSTP
jgi:cell division protein FtsB